MRAPFVALAFCATGALAAETRTTTAGSFGCRDPRLLVAAAHIIAAGTQRQFQAFMGAAVVDGHCATIPAGQVVTVEKRASDAAICARRRGDPACLWMPGEAFD